MNITLLATLALLSNSFDNFVCNPGNPRFAGAWSKACAGSEVSDSIPRTELYLKKKIHALDQETQKTIDITFDVADPKHFPDILRAEIRWEGSASNHARVQIRHFSDGFETLEIVSSQFPEVTFAFPLEALLSQKTLQVQSVRDYAPNPVYTQGNLTAVLLDRQ